MSYGMDDGDDIYMRSWTGTIIGPHNVSILFSFLVPPSLCLVVRVNKSNKISTLSSIVFTITLPFFHHFGVFFSCFQSVHEGRIYQLKLFCDKDYPEKPPSVRFHSRVNMTCVNHETGVVSKSSINILLKLMHHCC